MTRRGMRSNLIFPFYVFFDHSGIQLLKQSVYVSMRLPRRFAPRNDKDRGSHCEFSLILTPEAISYSLFMVFFNHSGIQLLKQSVYVSMRLPLKWYSFQGSVESMGREVVPGRRLELLQVAPHGPQPCASASSATPALVYGLIIQ